MLNPLRRASLILDDPERFEASLDKKRQKEWNRLERRLAERGGLVPRVAADGESIEQFLDLEARGWKGARATALKQEPNRAAFAREMLAGLAGAGRHADPRARTRRRPDCDGRRTRRRRTRLLLEDRL